MPAKAKKAAAKPVKKTASKAKPTTKKSAARKPAAVRDRASTATPARLLTRRVGAKSEVIGIVGSITTEEIALKAYYLAERRRHLGLPGDPEADWLEAERELHG